MIVYCNNLDLSSEPKFTFTNLKKGVQEFHRKFALAQADKAANNVVVVWKMYYIKTLKQELSTAKTYEHNLLDERYDVNRHRCHMAATFGVFVGEDHGRLPTLYTGYLNSITLHISEIPVWKYLLLRSRPLMQFRVLCVKDSVSFSTLGIA